MEKIIFLEDREIATDIYFDYIEDILTEASALITGNRDYSTMNYIANNVAEDMQELDEIIKDFNYYHTSDFIEALEKATNKKYKMYRMAGYCQRDWNYLFYEEGKLTQTQLDYINDIYFGCCGEYIDQSEDEDNNGCCYLVTDSEYNNTEELKKILASLSGYKAEAIQIGRVTGYRQIPIYKYI